MGVYENPLLAEGTQTMVGWAAMQKVDDACLNGVGRLMRQYEIEAYALD